MAAAGLLLFYSQQRCGGVGSGHCRGGAAAAAAPRRRRPACRVPPVYFQNHAFREVIDSSRRKLHWSVSIRVLNFRWGHPKPSLLTSSNAAADLVGDAAARLRGGGGAILVFLKATLRRSWFGKLPRQRRGGGGRFLLHLKKRCGGVGSGRCCGGAAVAARLSSSAGYPGKQCL